MVNLLNRLGLDKKLYKLDSKNLLLIILISLVLLALDYNFIISWQSKNTSQIQQKITRLKKDMDSLAKDLVTMEKTKIKIKEVPISKVQKMISEEELPSLLQEISDLANKKNVKIMQIKPIKELKTKETKPTAVQISGKSTLLLITLDLFSSYHNLGSFINGLENASVYMAVDGIKITPNQENYFQQQVNLVLKTYAAD